VKSAVLKEVGQAITVLPATFNPHKAIKRIYEQRNQMIEKGDGVDWAFGTLLTEGNHVRLSGQDVERGTFSHRHAKVHDQKNGQIYCPLEHVLKNQEPEFFTVSNRCATFFDHLSPLFTV
jgi:2-oxoglutarate dehydrogenase E1 component